MSFIAPGLVSATSSPPSDGIVRSTRSAASSDSAVRKSFSSVLQGVRGEEKKGNTQEAESHRGASQVEGRPDTKQSKSLNSAASQTERAEATQVRTSDSASLKSKENQTGDDSQEESESPLPQSHAGSAAEGQMVVAMTPTSVLQAGAQVMVSGAPDPHAGLPASDGECSSAEASPSIPMATDASVQPTENRSFEKTTLKTTASVPPTVSEQAQDASPSQKGAESHVTQSAELKGSEAQNDAKGQATDSVKTQAAIQASSSGGTISSFDHTIARPVQTHDGKLLPGSQFDRNLVALDRGENGVAHHPTDNQAPLLVPTHEDQGDTGPRTQGIIPHEQQLVVDQEELFSQSGHEQDGRQQGNPEAKLFQGTVVDLPSMNGRTTEHYAAVAQSQTNFVPTAPPPTVIVPSAQAVSSAPDPTQQSTPPILRSVVLEVAQPELGHVNIRVAMMNESVHAHFSTDRADVGQFLINGQDRLQTALQVNGLDMGQFRVDIDRQSSGRSFHQGLFQEQAPTWNQRSQGGGTEQAQGWSDDARSLLQGRLNLVA
ncbi:MAG: flagellar hook-length control protein FliK [Nitrospira sp.]|nr:flagellar hook-length control protein FliK [Nitrospira sp.]